MSPVCRDQKARRTLAVAGIADPGLWSKHPFSGAASSDARYSKYARRLRY
jgi:hypothetical protein